MIGFELHLYNAAPTAIVDNAAYNLPSGDRAKYIGYIDLDAPKRCGDTLISDTKNIGFDCKLASSSTTLYGILVTKGAFTPTALTQKSLELGILEV
jgi:hypothetical protein